MNKVMNVFETLKKKLKGFCDMNERNRRHIGGKNDLTSMLQWQHR